MTAMRTGSNWEPTGNGSAALDDLRGRILARFPATTFKVGPGLDDPTMILLYAIVDMDDPDEVLDAVADRVLEYQVDHDIPVHVIPMRTLERIEAMLAKRADRSTRAVGFLSSWRGNRAITDR